jgi:hypothetical protein
MKKTPEISTFCRKKAKNAPKFKKSIEKRRNLP